MSRPCVAPCGPVAARFAVMRWHYSRCMPAGRSVAFGAWEGGDYAGAVVFARGASPHLGTPYGLGHAQVCELARVALRAGHAAPVSAIVAAALRQLKAGSPGLRLVVSFADPARGHHGGIYQAMNWTYCGVSAPSKVYTVHGRECHERNFSPTQMGRATGMHQTLEWIRENLDPGATVRAVPGKHRYLMPLDKGMRRQLLPLALPYPERAAEVSTATRPASGGEGQVRPLRAALGDDTFRPGRADAV